MPTVIDLSTLPANVGFIIQGDVAGDSAGRAVSFAGDINGDGINDLIIGAPRGDDGGDNAGEAYVIYGRVGDRVTLDLTNLTAADGFIIQGDALGDEAGRAVAAAGDVNGDGIDDLIIGAPDGNDGGIDAGEAYVIYGRAGSERGRIDLSSLTATDGFIIQGDEAGDYAGRAVSFAGDINGDGIDDLIIGASHGDDGGYNAGEAYVIYGRVGDRVTLDLTNLTAADGFIIQGDTVSDRAGSAVAAAGDVNGDGIGDLIVGAPRGNDGGGDAGEAYVIFGRAGVTRGLIDLTNFVDADGFIIQGDAAGDEAGRVVAAAGDVNGDGIDDLIVGAYRGGNGGLVAGEAYVIYGSRPSTAVLRNGTEISQVILGGNLRDTINGLGGNDTIDGGKGADTLNGGLGMDILRYASSEAAVQINLATNTAAGVGSDAAGDLIFAFEGVIGSNFNDDLLQTQPSAEMQRAHDAVGPDTVAKFLFTSGTTGSPKAVIQTQRMLCANQAMVQNAYDFLATEPPVLVDWAPWNHTASGNKVFNMAIYNGGTYYIDDGRPTPDAIGRTIRTLCEVAPTWYFNVPVGYQFLLDAMETDTNLAQTFFSRLRMMMYAGAGMSQPVWDRLSAAAERQVAGGVPIVSGLGATETGPFALYYSDKKDRPGNIGVPALGVTLKLVPQDGKLEARVKSPSITPGYWRNPDLTAAAFDDEGFYKLGDALRYAVDGDAAAGFIFDGRLAENFKLATGTWVAVGALRAALVDAMAGLISDAVIAGENKDDLRALLVPNRAALAELVGQDQNFQDHPAVRAALTERLSAHARTATGSAARVVAALVLQDPLSFDKGEVTDKGSVNQRAVLRERAELVETLWSGGPQVILADWKEHK